MYIYIYIYKHCINTVASYPVSFTGFYIPYIAGKFDGEFNLTV